jgi:hypothetical protein
VGRKGRGRHRLLRRNNQGGARSRIP